MIIPGECKRSNNKEQESNKFQVVNFKSEAGNRGLKYNQRSRKAAIVQATENEKATSKLS